MDLLYFRDKIKGLKSAGYCTGFRDKFKCSFEQDKKIYSLYINDILQLKIHFAKPKEYLTIFEAHVMYLLFVKKRKPLDYARWDKTKGGEKFIQDIESIYINEPQIYTKDNLKVI